MGQSANKEESVPTYQYACTECEAQMEIVQSFSDDALTVCPECEGRLRKVYSAVGIVFKGSGFYRTDSGTKSSAGSAAAASGSDDKGGEKSADTTKSTEKGSGGTDSTKKSDTSAPAAAPSSAKVA